MNFDAYCAGKIDEAGYFAQLITQTLGSWKKQINTHIMEPQDTARERKEVVDFLKSATKQLEQICRDIKRADVSFETAVESGKRHWSTYESKNRRNRKLSIKEDIEDKKYNAKAYIGEYGRHGLMDSIETDDFEELKDWCWEKIHDGVWLSVDNDETGSYAYLELPEDAEYLDYYDLDDCIIRKDSAKEVVSFNDLY